MLNKIRKKDGSLSIEVTLLTALILPMMTALVVSMAGYFTADYKNSNLNFEVGRYVQVVGCDANKLKTTIPNLRQFKNYSIIVNDEAIQDGGAGTVNIACPVPTAKGSEFTVTSSLKTYATLFPRNITQVGYYVQEAK